MELSAIHAPDVRRQGAVQSPIVPVCRSEAILQGQREVLIQHGDVWYRLRHTSNGKLILTK